MNKVERIIVSTAAVIAIGIGFPACDKLHPAEDAGRALDKVAEKATDKLNEASASVSNQSEKAGVAIDDAAITTKVKAAILAEPGLSVLQIGVNTTKGVVTLTGSVDAPKSGERAKEIAANITGVREVDNRLLPKTTG